MYEENEPYHISLFDKNSARQLQPWRRIGGLSIYLKLCESILADEPDELRARSGSTQRHLPERAHQSDASSDFEPISAGTAYDLFSLRDLPPRLRNL
jgi:hypothetical protein